MASSIGARLKALRQGKEYTLEYVGDIVGTSKQTLYKYENGIITNIPSDKIEALAKLYSTTPGYIMGWDNGNVSVKYHMDFDDKSPMHALTQAIGHLPVIVQNEIIRRLETLNTTFAQNVSRLLKASGDINGFMKETGLSFDTVGKFMQGEPVQTSPEEAERIAAYFDADIVEMFFGKVDLFQEVEKIEDLLDDEIVVMSKDSLTRGLLLSLKKCVEGEKQPSYEKTKEAIELMKAFTFDMWLHRAFELTSANFKKSYKKEEILDVIAKEIYKSTKRLWEMYNQKSDSASDFAEWIMTVVRKAKESDSEQ